MFTDKRGVDHESYAYQLALDMGAAPTITHVMSRGWKIFFTWAMGSNFNTKFRLVGPWKWEAGAEEIMRGELYNVVKRSGGFVCKCCCFCVKKACANCETSFNDLLHSSIYSTWRHERDFVRSVLALRVGRQGWPFLYQRVLEASREPDTPRVRV